MKKKIKNILKSLMLKVPFGEKMVSSIGRFYARYLMFGLPNKDVVVPCNGLQMLVRNPRESSLGRSVFYDGIWETKAYHFISTKLKTGMTVLDVGAA